MPENCVMVAGFQNIEESFVRELREHRHLPARWRLPKARARCLRAKCLSSLEASCRPPITRDPGACWHRTARCRTDNRCSDQNHWNGCSLSRISAAVAATTQSDCRTATRRVTLVRQTVGSTASSGACGRAPWRRQIPPAHAPGLCSRRSSRPVFARRQPARNSTPIRMSERQITWHCLLVLS
jgi:hypothetical protein